MYVKECPNCKEIFSAKDRKQVCCCRECANEYASVKAQMRRSKKPIVEFDGDYEWIKGKDGKYACRYNQGCFCYTRNCERCGWNPAVAEERTKAIRNQMQGVPV